MPFAFAFFFLGKLQSDRTQNSSIHWRTITGYFDIFVWVFLVLCCLGLILLLVTYETFENKDCGSSREFIMILTDVHQNYSESMTETRWTVGLDKILLWTICLFYFDFF